MHVPVADIQPYRRLPVTAEAAHLALLSVDAIAWHATFREAALLISSHGVAAY